MFARSAESMYNAEKRGKRQVLVRPVSKVVIKFLQVMQKHGTCEERGTRAGRARTILKAARASQDECGD